MKTIICIINKGEYHPLVIGTPGQQRLFTSNNTEEINHMVIMLLQQNMCVRAMCVTQDTFNQLKSLMHKMEQVLISMCDEKISTLMQQCQSCLGPYLNQEGDICETTN